MTHRIIAGLLLVASAPLLVLLALVIRVCDGAPVLFRQERQGIGRAPFTIWKLRTMTDGQVTRCGRLLRRSGLDELPQLVNVVRGEMRFVGPRPLTSADVERLGWDDAAHDGRWTVAPGLTGYAQLAPVCDRDLSRSLDDDYARNRTLALDLRILSASALAVVVGRDRAKRVFWR
jgi:lipopolysaccharide/colanic/teichoic acid biosynthesis glycosyltransferase